MKWLSLRNSWALVLVAIVIATALRPGDTTFIADEPVLLQTALTLNHRPGVFLGMHLPFSLCIATQLRPTHGLFYGPAAVWVYQVLLAVTYNPLAIVVLHAFFLAGMTAFALAWLAKSIKVSPWLAVATMLSPWLWIYHRMLWDNNLCVPLAAMMLAGYADFTNSRRGISLFVCGVCAALLPLIHPMALAIVAALAVEAVVFQFGALLKKKWSLLAGIVVVNIFGWPYWQYVAQFYQPMKPAEDLSAWRGWVYPLLGAHHISAAGLGSNLGSDWLYTLPGPAPYMVMAAQTFTLLSYLAVWGGIVLAFVMLAGLKFQKEKVTPASHVAVVALGTVICQSIMDGVLRIYDGPHYFNATWVAYAVLAWVFVTAICDRYAKNSVLVRAMIPTYTVAMAVVLGAMIYKVARDSGCRDIDYGTSLASQIEAAEQVSKFSADSPKMISVPQWARSPWALNVLGELLPSGGDEAQKPKRLVIIRYRGLTSNDAAIAVEDHPL